MSKLINRLRGARGSTRSISLLTFAGLGAILMVASCGDLKPRAVTGITTQVDQPERTSGAGSSQTGAQQDGISAAEVANVTVGAQPDGTYVAGVAVVGVAAQRAINFSGAGDFVRMDKSSSATASVSTSVAADTVFTVNTDNFAVGSQVDGYLSLGTIAITEISSNDLYQCGTNNDELCDTVTVYVYSTTVQTNDDPPVDLDIEGFVNVDDAYGVPLEFIGLAGSSTVLLGEANKKQLIQYTLGSGQYAFEIAPPLAPNPVEGGDPIPLVNSVTAYMANAGAGVYKVSLVIMYELSKSS